MTTMAGSMAPTIRSMLRSPASSWRLARSSRVSGREPVCSASFKRRQAALVVALAPALREKFTGWFRRSFGGRGILGQMAVARFASSMSMAVASGLTMEDSVELAAKPAAPGSPAAPPPPP